MVEKIQKGKSGINLSNKLFYFSVLFVTCLLVGAGVSAYANTAGVGHGLDEIEPCAAGKILQTNLAGDAWECVDIATGGFDGEWGISGELTDDHGASIELGGTGTPYIDFSNDATSDYDMRIILTGDDGLNIAGGNFGIGVPNPTAKLAIGGLTEIRVEDADTQLRFIDPLTSWYAVGIDYSDGSKFKINYGAKLGDEHGFTMTKDGEVTIDENLTVTGPVTAKEFIYASDRRLKENIQTIPNALEKVKALEGVSFEWIDDETDDKNLGFIAQDIEKILPEVVSTNKDGFKAVEYGNIIAVLVEAIKEQQKEIEELKLKLGN